MRYLGFLLQCSNPQRWLWWGRAAVLGPPGSFAHLFSRPVQEFNSGSGSGAVVFQIGRALNGHVNVEDRTVFGVIDIFDNLMSPANTAISFYKSQLSSCRRAVDAWSHVGIRYGAVKDIRILIGKLVWETRDLAMYKV
jgi:hypothetical protein